MKKTTYITALAIFCFTMVAGIVHAQDTNSDSHTIGIAIPTVALVDIEPAASKNITMDFVAPTEAGLPIQAPTDNSDLWLNYSLIPSASGETATVTVALTNPVAGMDVILSAAADASGGDGAMGTVAGTLTLSTTSQTIIEDIGASYTGDGANSGHNLTYSLSVAGGTSDYSALFTSNNTVTVTYTISE